MKKLMSLVVITLLCMGNAFAQKKGVWSFRTTRKLVQTG